MDHKYLLKDKEIYKFLFPSCMIFIRIICLIYYVCSKELQRKKI